MDAVGRLDLFVFVPLLFLSVSMTLISHGSFAPHFMYSYCPDTAFFPADNSAYRANIDALLSNLSAAANRSSIAGFSNLTVGSGTSRSPTIYGLYLCRGGDDPATCRECVATASSYLSENCPRGSQAADWYDECMVRYSNASIFGQLDDGLSVIAWNLNNVTINVTGFTQVLDATLTKVVKEAPADTGGQYKYLATYEAPYNAFQTMYALGQCTPDLSASDCFECLQKGYGVLSTWTRLGGRALYFSCNLRYESSLFYEKSSKGMTSIHTYCPNTNLFAATNYVLTSNIKALLSNLSTAANISTNPGFHNETIGSDTPTAIYGLYLCRGDVIPATCRDCVAAASVDLPKNCPHGKQAVILYDECMIRYSNQPFFGHLDSNLHPLWNVTENASTSIHDSMMGAALVKATDKVVSEALPNGKAVEDGIMFGTAQQNIIGDTTMYMMGQCTPDLSTDDCNHCLQNCSNFLTNSIHLTGGTVYYFNCYLRYELYQFYQSSPPSVVITADPGAIPPPPNKSRHSRGYDHLVITCSVTGVVLLLLCLALWVFVFKRKVKAAYTTDLTDIIDTESLQMDFNAIRAATQNFASDKKLGQGGFGSVYKGTLENGQDIAVKRLSHNSTQGIVEFKTEVLLVAKLQHRNLVKLLGFCVSGKEIILVYEFLSNSSLDKILFDPTKRMSLNWETRFKIICGIAKGLMYLHEDSRLRVVHRDLKSSNILLDESMNPKISDFGLAKLFSVDQTQDVTESIAGTYGYMAPEYVLLGHYSIKSDVYSFGILVLEVVSGQRNKYLHRPLLEAALLYRAWKFWHEGEALELVDDALGGNFSREDAIKCIHIGLLCIQESVAGRPNMTSVVAALSGQSVTLPLPSPPNFFNKIDPSSTFNTSSSGVGSGQGVSILDTTEITELHGR